MNIKISLIFLLISQYGFSQEIPKNFYMIETYKRFEKIVGDEDYTSFRFVNNNFISIAETRLKKDNRIIGKYEAKYINPLNDTSYNDYHQIVKYYEYKGGRIFRVQKKLSRIEGCEIICDNEYIYKNEKIVKKYNIQHV